jgi:hypothetical protein
MSPASPATINLNNNLGVELSVKDTIDEPDTQPWALCGIIAGPPTASSDELFPHDSFGYLIPGALDIGIIQDENNDALVFPQGGTAGDWYSFTCDELGTDEVYIHYMTSRLVSDCKNDSLLIMQNDLEAEKKSIYLGKVKCIDPTNPPPPEEAGVIHSPGREDIIEEGQESEIPEGFEYLGPQTIEVTNEGEFIDKGYLDQGNPPSN